VPKIQHLITCEHASNHLPKRYADLFQGTHLLETHQGWDIGAGGVATAIAKQLNLPIHLAQYSRLLVDLNRSLHHPKIFSPRIKALSAAEKRTIIDEYYLPYRNAVNETIKQILQQGKTLQHISVHSFTPILNGQRRNCDIGLLYDPSRKLEKQFALRLQSLLQGCGLKVRMNYPYRGINDAFVTQLRRINTPERYQCIELEINQAFFDRSGHPLADIVSPIRDSLCLLW
jgi:predicted N-formylglutamate amidohydrolase